MNSTRPPAPLLRELTRPWAPPRGARVVVAVSGGADSVALLALLAWLAPGRGWTLHVASLDHGLRGAEGAADLGFVGGLAERFGLSATLARAEPAPRAGRSPEEAARDARLAFLAGAAVNAGAGVIALGHTADDQAETVLFRLARGSGLRGVGAMRRFTEPFWRPLLGVRRAALRDSLDAAGIPWREDPSNTSVAFARNRIRHEVLPALERAVGPGAVHALCRAAELAAEDDEALAAAAATAAQEVVLAAADGQLEIDRRAVQNLPPAVSRRILRECCERLAGTPQAVASRHLAALLALARGTSPGTRADLPGGLTARRRGARLILTRTSETQA